MATAAPQQLMTERLSTQDVCREAAEKLNSIKRNSLNSEKVFKEDGGSAVQLDELRNDQPPPYTETSVLIPIEREEAVQSFLVPPPPPPSPGDALRTSRVMSQDVPAYQAVPLPSCPPMTAVPSDSLLRPSPALQHMQQPVQNLPQTLSYTNPLRPPSVLFATPTMAALGGQPQQQYAPPPPQQPVGPGVIPVAPPPPPIVGQHSTQNITNQNVNTNTNQNVNNINVNVETNVGMDGHRYPSYMCFSMVLLLLCCVIDPVVLLCAIPALICSCISYFADTYRGSRIGGKFALACNITALISGIISFLCLILPVIITFSLAGAGAIVLGSLLRESSTNDTPTDDTPTDDTLDYELNMNDHIPEY